MGANVDIGLCSQEMMTAVYAPHIPSRSPRVRSTPAVLGNGAGHALVPTESSTRLETAATTAIACRASTAKVATAIGARRRHHELEL